MIRISRRRLILVVGALLAIVLTFVVVQSGVIAAALQPVAVADAKALDAQRAAAERGIQRAYVAGADQVEKSKQLKLAISDTQADALRQKAISDLKTLRHSALVSLAGVLGSDATESEAYARAAEQRIEAAGPPDRTSTDPVLLAPRLFAIVQRMDEIAPQLTDKALRNLTVAPTAKPSSAP